MYFINFLIYIYLYFLFIYFNLNVFIIYKKCFCIFIISIMYRFFIWTVFTLIGVMSSVVFLYFIIYVYFCYFYCVFVLCGQKKWVKWWFILIFLVCIYAHLSPCCMVRCSNITMQYWVALGPLYSLSWSPGVSLSREGQSDRRQHRDGRLCSRRLSTSSKSRGRKWNRKEEALIIYARNRDRRKLHKETQR